MSPSLDEFLVQFAALLDGAAVSRELKASLSIYATLVARQQRGVLDAFYAATRVAAGAERFAKYRDAFLAEHPPSHWVPARAAEHFGAFLEREASSVVLRELADHAWTRHLVLHAPTRDDGSGLAVRHYTHSVREFSVEVESGHRRSGRPMRKPETWLIGRSRKTSGLVVLEPSVAALVVLQVLEDRGWSAELPDVSRADVVSEARHLHGQQLLSDVALEQLARWLA